MQLSDDFLRQTADAFGRERLLRFLEALDHEAPTSIRLNPLKTAAADLRLCVPGAERVGWCPEGWYLSQRPAFTFDPLLHGGCYYVQEASSMFVAHALRQLVRRPVALLDLCAAPGGKSTAARTALPEGSVLVSNEPVGKRAQVLVENVQKWGHADCLVTSNLPRDFSRSRLTFDVVLCDVPCSGEGMFRRSAQRDANPGKKDTDAQEEWSLEAVERCWRLQRDIVGHAWQCLAEGGYLIYSTCTYNIKEDERNVQWMTEELGAEPVALPTDEAWGITGSLLSGFAAPVYRFIPGYTRGEGLFVAVVRKPQRGGAATSPSDAATGPAPQLSAKALRTLHVLYDGPTAGTAKGRDVVPDPAEALAVDLPRTKYPRVALGYAQALAYLRHEALTLDADAPRGIVVVTFEGTPLGFAKNLGTRANNLYPQAWRIKSTHIPNDYEAILRHP